MSDPTKSEKGGSEFYNLRKKQGTKFCSMLKKEGGGGKPRSLPTNLIYTVPISAYPFILWWLSEYDVLHIIIIMKSEEWLNSHCLWLGHELMACALYLYIIIDFVI